MSHSGIMSCNTPISSPLTAPRAESIRPSTPKRSVTPSRTDRGLSEASAFQISPKVDEALIKVEGHNDHILTTVGDVADFLPFQQLLATKITIHFGPKLNEKRTVHLELLKCYSKHVKDLFDTAESQHEAYRQGKIIRTQVKALLPPKTSQEMFAVGNKESGELVKNAMNLIIRCIGNYPVREHQHSVKDCLVDATTKLFQDKHMWKNAPGASELKKKEKDYHPVNHLRHRLQVLNSEAIFNVLMQLNYQLWVIKCAEVDLARTSNLRAAAQRKLLLPNNDLDTISPLLQWLYQGRLHIRTPVQLCKVYGLADNLGVTNLTQTCLSRLSTEAFDAIKRATSEGMTLRALIDSSQASSQKDQPDPDKPFAGIVWTVFEFVLQHQNPPMELQHMVIEAIANSADNALVKSLIPKMSVGILQQLTRALMSRWSGAAPYMGLITKQNDLGSQGGESEVDSPKPEFQSLEKLESTPDSQLASEIAPVTTYQGNIRAITGEQYQQFEHHS